MTSAGHRYYKAADTVYSVAVSPDADIRQMGSTEISAAIYSVRKVAIGCNKVI